MTKDNHDTQHKAHRIKGRDAHLLGWLGRVSGRRCLGTSPSIHTVAVATTLQERSSSRCVVPTLIGNDRRRNHGTRFGHKGVVVSWLWRNGKGRDTS
eukprot:scaffold2989_cov184-Amphora_coffeaeformis.AAC.9